MGNHDWNLRDIYFTPEAKQTLLPLYKDYMGGDSYYEVKKILNKSGDVEMYLLSFNNSEDMMTNRPVSYTHLPVTLLIYGIVREARGLTSMTYNSF